MVMLVYQRVHLLNHVLNHENIVFLQKKPLLFLASMMSSSSPVHWSEHHNVRSTAISLRMLYVVWSVHGWRKWYLLYKAICLLQVGVNRSRRLAIDVGKITIFNYSSRDHGFPISSPWRLIHLIFHIVPTMNQQPSNIPTIPTIESSSPSPTSARFPFPMGPMACPGVQDPWQSHHHCRRGT